MNRKAYRLAAAAAALAAVMLFSSCALVTVPVKTAGSIAETTISTTGTVVSSPFQAMGGRKQSKDAE